MMDVAKNVWTLAGDTSPSRIDLQNVGDTRIGFVMAMSLPGAGAFLAEGDHGFLHPGAPLLTLLSLSTNVYVRAFGPKNGKLFVNSVT
jgi:hypothetical protein